MSRCVEAQLFTHHRVNQLNSIVLGRVMTGSHHNTNPLSAELLRAQTGKQTDSENDSVEKVTAHPASERAHVNKRTIAGMRG